MSSLGQFGVVVDSGSNYIKAGFSGEACPRAVFPTVVGRFRHPSIADASTGDTFFGEEAVSRRGMSNLVWPVRDGMVQEWQEMEIVWHHTFYKALMVPPEDTNVLFTLHPLTEERDKVRIAEIMFECFAIPALYLASSPSLVLHASGRTTGVVWEAGAMCAYAAPVFEGFPLRHAVTVSPLTGEALSDVFRRQLSKVGYSFTTSVERDLLDSIKTKYCFVSSNYDQDIMRARHSGEVDAKFVLPDGQSILLGEPRFACPEVMFQPALEDLKCPSIVDVICQTIEKCDFDYKLDFYGNIVMSGGSSMFRGLKERLTSELLMRAKSLPECKVGVDGINTREFAAWAGGSILSSLSSMKGFWMTKRDYEDSGSAKVRYAFD